jgi:hypothetical protein
MTMFMQQFQQMMNYFLTSRENQQHQQQPYQQSQQQSQQSPYHQPQPYSQQHQYQHQSQQLSQQLSQQHSQQPSQQQSQQSQQLTQQQSQQLSQQSPQRSQQLFTSTPSQQQEEQYQHYSPDHQQRNDFRTYQRPSGPGGYYSLSNSSMPPQQLPQRPAIMPPDTVWDPYQGRIVPANGDAASVSQQPPQPTSARQPEEQIEFDYRTQGQTQMSQLSDQPMSAHQQKSEPGGSGPTDMTPAKKKPFSKSSSAAYFAAAPTGATLENSPSESAGGVE